MAVGPGKYDDICTAVLVSTRAQGAIVMVLGGVRGTGFSLASLDPNLAAKLPALLREVADQIEVDVKNATN